MSENVHRDNYNVCIKGSFGTSTEASAPAVLSLQEGFHHYIYGREVVLQIVTPVQLRYAYSLIIIIY